MAPPAAPAPCWRLATAGTQWVRQPRYPRAAPALPYPTAGGHLLHAGYGVGHATVAAMPEPAQPSSVATQRGAIKVLAESRARGSAGPAAVGVA